MSGENDVRNVSRRQRRKNPCRDVQLGFRFIDVSCKLESWGGYENRVAAANLINHKFKETLVRNTRRILS